MIPHLVHQIREDEDAYVDSYLIVSLLFDELYSH